MSIIKDLNIGTLHKIIECDFGKFVVKPRSIVLLSDMSTERLEFLNQDLAKFRINLMFA